MDTSKISAVDIANGVCNGNFTVSEIANSVIELYNEHKQENSIISVDEKKLLKEAAILDKKLLEGELLPLHGVPFVVKDNIDSKGHVTAAGTSTLKDNRAENNSVVVQRLVDAGALVVGKSGMHELACGVTNNNSYWGAVRNPHNLDMMPGGSSGGSAAAVAAGIVPFSLGTDTGGSCRVPASLCGVVGFRPTTSRYSSKGVILISHTRDTIGVFTRTTADLKYIDAIITGDMTDEIINIRKVKAGIPRKPFYKGLEKEVEKVIDIALEKLSIAGLQIEEIDIDIDETVVQAGFNIVTSELKEDIIFYLQENQLEITFEDIINNLCSPDVFELLSPLLDKTIKNKESYNNAVNVVRPNLQETYNKYFLNNKLDVILLPTTVATARPIGHDKTIELNGLQVPTFLTYARNTDASSVAGIPSLSIPAGTVASGLPIGLSVEAMSHDDRRLISIGGVVEEIIGVKTSW